MKKIKFKILGAIILAIGINIYSLDIFANPTTENNTLGNSMEQGTDNVTTTKSTILDGEIGEWDPGISDKPNFSDTELEVDGKLPQENEYYTISVTVPLNMEFVALDYSTFCSPVYTIKNNGSKDISVKLSTFSRQDNTTLNDENTIPLHVEKVNRKDDRAQIELRICTIEDVDSSVNVNKRIDLVNLTDEIELYRLSANQKKGVTFDAQRWDLPQTLPDDGKAISNFNANFIFSIVK